MDKKWKTLSSFFLFKEWCWVFSSTPQREVGWAGVSLARPRPVYKSILGGSEACYHPRLPWVTSLRENWCHTQKSQWPWLCGTTRSFCVWKKKECSESRHHYKQMGNGLRQSLGSWVIKVRFCHSKKREKQTSLRNWKKSGPISKLGSRHPRRNILNSQPCVVLLCLVLLCSSVYVHMHVSVCTFCFFEFWFLCGRALFLTTKSSMGSPPPLSFSLTAFSVGAQDTRLPWVSLKFVLRGIRCWGSWDAIQWLRMRLVYYRACVSPEMWANPSACRVLNSVGT